ncbi:MAG: oligosaccharide flippase family protein [bacterium]
MVNSPSNQIVKNIFYLTTGQILNLILSFISITFAARMLGVNEFGKFGYLLAIVTVLSKIVDLGFSSIVFRELSIKRNSFEMLNLALTIRLYIFFIVVVLLNISSVFFSFTLLEIFLLNILFINVIFSSKFVLIRELLDLPFKVNLKMQYPIIATNIDNIILIVLVLLIPFFKDKLSAFVIGYTISNIPGLILMLFFLKKKFNYKFEFNLKLYKWLLKESFPLYGFILLDTIYQQMDVILLKNLVNYHDAGIYSVSIRLVMPLIIFPTAIIHSVFPTLSKNNSSSENNNFLLINMIFKVLFFISFVCALMFFFKASEIITIIYGPKYSLASGPTSILLFSQIFIFYNYFVINLMVAYKKQSLDFFYAILVLVASFGFNILFIPSYSFIGVGIAKLATAFLGFLYAAYILYKTDKKIYLFNKKTIIWAFWAWGFLYLLSFFGLVLFAILGVIVIMVSVFIMKYFCDEEIIFIFNILRKPEWGKKIVKYDIMKIWS